MESSKGQRSFKAQDISVDADIAAKGLTEVTWTKSNARLGQKFTHAHSNITWATAGMDRRLISVKQPRKKGTKNFPLFFFKITGFFAKRAFSLASLSSHGVLQFPAKSLF